MNNKYLFLDDVRDPIHAFGYTNFGPFVTKEWEIVRNYDEFVNYIKTNGLPYFIAFDHDLGELDSEIWKNIEGYDGIYEISDKGRVRNRNKIMSQYKNESGMYIRLYKNKKSKLHKVHRLVAKTFIENPENKKTVNHIDGNRWNNKLENLEWATISENVKHSHEYLHRDYSAYGENHKNSKTITKYNKNMEYICTYGSVNEAGRQNKIPFTNIAKCARGERNTAGGFIWRYENKEVDKFSEIEHILKEKGDYMKRFFIPNEIEKTGFDCAKFLVEYCMENNLKLPEFYVHSMNPVGKDNIVNYLNNFKKYYEI